MGLNLIVRQLNAWIYHRVTSQNYCQNMKVYYELLVFLLTS